MIATYTPNPATETAMYTYLTRTTDGWNLVARYMTDAPDYNDRKHGTAVVGTATEEDVKMRVGRGAMIHDGYVLHVTVTANHTVASENTRRPNDVYAAGDTWTTEPANACGASGQLRSCGFARNRNSRAAADAPVTCTKCQKRAAKRA